MRKLEQETFVCLDCETTGLDTSHDQIIEIAVAIFNFHSIIKRYETLVKPTVPISEESREIHHISDSMVAIAPSIEDVLPTVVEMIKGLTIVGHGIQFDIDMIYASAKRISMPFPIEKIKSIDTLRLARLYGDSPSNSLGHLRQHFNIQETGTAHRAMTDVMMNIEVFKKLSMNFQSSRDIFNRLKQPILMKNMPLGKHKGRPFKEIPIDYLKWAVRQQFDDDLLFSIKKELKSRKQPNTFSTAANPFNNL